MGECVVICYSFFYNFYKDCCRISVRISVVSMKVLWN